MASASKLCFGVTTHLDAPTTASVSSDVAPDSVLVQPEALHLDPAGAADLRDTLEHAA